MIPLHLRLSGFLSYREPVEIDFTTFELACISGSNGAGKSSLLDAITWALYGKARKQDDSLIHTLAKSAEVSLIFTYEGNIYRIQRTKIRDKTGMLEFQILQPGGAVPGPNVTLKDILLGSWKTLTEHSMTETNARIQETLRLDYETFVNASFFLQGKADQFTQQRPGDRKRILSNILGLEIWGDYQKKALALRRGVEDEISGLDGQLREINTELAEEEVRKTRLKQLEGDLKRISAERAAQEGLLANVRKLAVTLAEQEKMVAALRRQYEASTQQLGEAMERLGQRRQERESYSTTISRSTEITAAFALWQTHRAELENLEQVAGRFHEQEQRRAGPREQIQAARARLEQELHMLQNEKENMEGLGREIDGLRRQHAAARQRCQTLDEEIDRLKDIDALLHAMREQWVELKSDIQRSEKDLQDLQDRRTKLEHIEGATCPLCGQPLSQEDRLRLLNSLAEQIAQASQALESSQAARQQLVDEADALKNQAANLPQLETDLRASLDQAARLFSKMETLENRRKTWQSSDAVRVLAISHILESGDYAPEAKAELAVIDVELCQIGYDPAQHEQLRQLEQAERAVEAEMRNLEKAQAALSPLEREIGELEQQSARLQEQVSRLQNEFDQAAAALAAAQAQAPDLEAVEQSVLLIQEKENGLRREVGAAHQLVAVLADLKTRRKVYETQREELARQVSLYKQLERAFSKDGVPSLLIEQALPQIEAKANEILDRLSGSSMSVRFITQAAYKDKVRQDLKETLDIQISDGSGTRDYEMFSGGEAFRVNFAIRLALSEVLAQRSGARLQTLVIDEGFGSQDTQGRQRLIEAINLVRSDFRKILVITHIDELKDAFPNRIEVEKATNGSTVRVI